MISFPTIKTEATPMMMALSGSKLRLMTRSPVDRQHSIAEMAVEEPHCFVPENRCRVNWREVQLIDNTA